MTISVPTSVDVEGLVSRRNLTRTKSENLKSRIDYFLSQVVVNNETVEFNKRTDYYRSICSKKMKKILGNKFYCDTLKILMDPNDPIIELNHSYSVGNYCMSYRMSEKYNTGETEFKELPKNLSQRIQKFKPENLELKELNSRYEFLINQYDEHRLTLSDTVYDYVSNFSIELLSRVNKDNKYQKLMICNLIGRWLYYIEKIQKGEYNPMVSSSNHRLNSLFTTLPKLLRGFVLCNGKQLHGVDIKGSQPFILRTIMNHNFLLNPEEKGYNLRSINPLLYNIVINKYNNIVNNNTNINNGYPYMWCSFFSILKEDGIEKYKQIPFDEDFYLYVVKKGFSNNKTEDELQKERDKFKKSMMLILFDDNENNRYHNLYFKLMKKVFPTVNEWIETTLHLIGKNTFSILLQRIESYLLLNHLSRRFYEKNPTIPIFTIHDGLYTYEEYIPELTSLTIRGLNEITGIRPGVKTESPRTNINPLYDDVEEKWSKIKNVKNRTKFDKVRGSVLTSNIQRAKMFFQERNIKIIF